MRAVLRGRQDEPTALDRWKLGSLALCDAAGPALPGAGGEEGAPGGLAGVEGQAPGGDFKGRPCNSCAFPSINGISCPVLPGCPAPPPPSRAARARRPAFPRACARARVRAWAPGGPGPPGVGPAGPRTVWTPPGPKKGRLVQNFGCVCGQWGLGWGWGGARGRPQLLPP